MLGALRPNIVKNTIVAADGGGADLKTAESKWSDFPLKYKYKCGSRIIVRPLVGSPLLSVCEVGTVKRINVRAK